MGRVVRIALGVAFVVVACADAAEAGWIRAWGNDWWGQVSDTPAGDDFVAVAAGGSHSLALRENGRVVAWGSDSYGQCQMPLDRFSAIAAGGAFSVGAL